MRAISGFVANAHGSQLLIQPCQVDSARTCIVTKGLSSIAKSIYIRLNRFLMSRGDTVAAVTWPNGCEALLDRCGIDRAAARALPRALR